MSDSFKYDPEKEYVAEQEERLKRCKIRKKKHRAFKKTHPASRRVTQAAAIASYHGYNFNW